MQGAIRASGLTQTEVDERIGRRRGYLSHVFQRRVDLKVMDLLRALDALGIPPSRFFEAVAEAAPTGSGGLLKLLAQRLASDPRPAAQSLPAVAAPPSPPVAGPAPETADEAELEERVRIALRSVLAQLGHESRAYGS